MSGSRGSQQTTGGAKELGSAQGDERDVRHRQGMVQRVEAARRLAIARAQPKPEKWEVLAEREGLCERQCRRLHADYLQDGLALGDPLDLVRGTLALINRTIVILGEVAEGDAHDSVRIGALRLMIQALGTRISLMVASGLMPRRLSAQRDHDDAVVLVARLAQVLERHNLGDQVIDELIEVVDGTAQELQATAVDPVGRLGAVDVWQRP